MANQHPPRRSLRQTRRLADASIELPTEDSDLRMGTRPPPKRKNDISSLVPSRESEQSDSEMQGLLSLESEDESGKHALYSARHVHINAPFS
jgi:hypothetical protein